jgi:hypothetical protein
MQSITTSFDSGANCRYKSLVEHDDVQKIDEEAINYVSEMMLGNSSMKVEYYPERNYDKDAEYGRFKVRPYGPYPSFVTLSEVFIRIKINRAFPRAEQIQKTMARLGYNWSKGDRFGPEVMSKWVVKIGVDVAVRAAQTILLACLAHTNRIPEVRIMYYSEEPQYRRSIFIGSKVFGQLQPRSQLELRHLLEPRITRVKFHKLAAGFRD